MRVHLLLLPLALAACATTPAANGNRATATHGPASGIGPGPTPGTSPSPTSSAASSATVPDAALLGGYHWQLTQATNRYGQRIGALFVRPLNPLQLDFDNGRISVRNSCNGMGGSYRIVDGRLVVGPLAHTMKACANFALNRLDGLIGVRLGIRPTITATRSGGTPLLHLHTSAGDTLVFTGVPTPESRYGSPGIVEYLEVAPQTVPCSHPRASSSQCIDVREVHYDANGLRTGTPGKWHLLLQPIEGYTHQPGVRNVLRVKRYALKHQPPDTPTSAYVLDMVVESELVRR
ncbi:DUF4377 domain-containing protein [Rhodanobacter aciditrophus]|uniref:DUF4377 domain-containing protein n=1 Tax=Rhodanobacter aciditrophus TaxID=1623218 RepID=UPI003CEE943E